MPSVEITRDVLLGRGPKPRPAHIRRDHAHAVGYVVQQLPYQRQRRPRRSSIRSRFGFTEEFVQNVSRTCAIFKSIRYIVCNHTEPDHSGSLAALLDLIPDAVVLCSKPASVFLRSIMNNDFECRTVGDGDSVDLGGKTLQFISAPFLHWPDSMFTYVPEDAVLLSGDVFGFHFAAENVFDDLTPLSEEMAAVAEVLLRRDHGAFQKLRAAGDREDPRTLISK